MESSISKLREMVGKDLGTLGYKPHDPSWEAIYREALMGWSRLFEEMASECRGQATYDQLFTQWPPEDEAEKAMLSSLPSGVEAASHQHEPGELDDGYLEQSKI